MGRARIFFMSVVIVSLLSYLAINALAGGKIVILEYNLKPVTAIDSGRRIKTEWSATVENRDHKPVRFLFTIIFIDGNNEEISQVKTQCELKAKETKTFSDTVVLEATIAQKIASTRVTIDETP
jgi:hypothetical protein